MLMATLLARMPDLRRRVQAQHVADHWGCCSECGGRVQWPCDLHQIAVAAERLARRRPHGPYSQQRLPEPRALRPVTNRGFAAR